MILLTGYKGFIGSNFYNKVKRTQNVISIEKEECFEFLSDFNSWSEITLVIHQGAISNTRETDWKKLEHFNINFSITLFNKIRKYKIPIRYASSASVYGNSFPKTEPLNKYAKSKLLLDNWVLENIDKFYNIQGLRYFNVYGDHENHKISLGQASPISKFIYDSKNLNKIKIFKGSDNIFRDFIFVEDVVELAINNSRDSGVYDLGSCSTYSFEDVAKLVQKKFGGEVETIDFPKDLKDSYQFHTESTDSWEGFTFTKIEDYLSRII